MLRVNFGGEVGDITSFTIYNKRDFLKRNLGPGDLNSSYYFLLQNQENNQKKRESKTVLLKQIAVGKKESKTVFLSPAAQANRCRPILARSSQALSLSFAVVPPFPGSIVREFGVLRLQASSPSQAPRLMSMSFKFFSATFHSRAYFLLQCRSAGGLWCYMGF
ncbi:hypothetical protein NL676_000002 [Syzygium grande]|nr:hypothetical protein NL676_000002 [Syzygium grande]